MKSFRKFMEDYSRNPLQDQDPSKGTSLDDVLASLLVAMESEADAMRVYSDIEQMAVRLNNSDVTNAIISVVRDIKHEEQKHYGQLLAIIKKLDPNFSVKFDEGKLEAENQIAPHLMHK